MNMIPPAEPGQEIEYPDSDGKPMAENTKQAGWITVLFGNLCALLREAADVFVAMDLFWYAVEGRPDIRGAPDVLVVFGRPKGDRGSYKQWQEDNIAVTVAVEILSPSNDWLEMADKLAFYDEHGVEEYYVYDPDTNRLAVYLRRGEALRRMWKPDGYVSPRLGIRFDLSGPEMVVRYPNGRPFRTFEELDAILGQAEQRLENVQVRADRQAELMRRVLGQQATPDELQELQQLLKPQTPSA